MAFRWTTPRVTRQYRPVSSLLLCLCLWLSGAPAWAGTIERIDIGHDAVTLHFDAAVASASGFVLDGPRRIAVDLAGVSGAVVAEPGGMISGIRSGGLGDGTRVVFELTRPAIVADGRIEDAGRALVLTLRPVDAHVFAQAARAGRTNWWPGWLGGAPGKPAYKVTMPVPPPSHSLHLPRVDGDASRPLVVIDAGHGGPDPGAIGEGGLREKDVTLRLAKAIRDDLLRSGRVRVALTRDDDRFLVLQERYGIARKLHADLFISVHCDSVGAGANGVQGASGASVYTLSEVASDKEAARLAVRENKADIIAGLDLGSENPDVSSILIDLTQRETMNSSASFARLLGREAQPLVPLKPQFHRMASLMVLKAPDMPSILFETGYISNPRDAAFLDSAGGRARIAESIRRATEIYFARRTAAN